MRYPCSVEEEEGGGGFNQIEVKHRNRRMRALDSCRFDYIFNLTAE